MTQGNAFGRIKGKTLVIFYLVHFAEEKGYSEFSFEELHELTGESFLEIEKEIKYFKKKKYINADIKCDSFSEKIKFYLLKFPSLLISNKEKAILAKKWQEEAEKEYN